MYIAGVTSNDPATTMDDIRFGRQAVCIRAERSNQVSARVYTITLESIDASGNIGTTDVNVQVPLQGNMHCPSDQALVVPDDDPSCNFGPHVVEQPQFGGRL